MQITCHASHEGPPSDHAGQWVTAQAPSAGKKPRGYQTQRKYELLFNKYLKPKGHALQITVT